MLRRVTHDSDPRAARREQILDIALKIADRDGFDGLTMRKLSAELGVSAPIVYRHFEDKAAIIDAIVEALVSRQTLLDRATMTPREWLHGTFSSMYGELSTHPGLLELLASAGPFAAHAMRITDEVLAALEAMGLDPQRAARGFRWLMGATMGAVMMERGAVSAIADGRVQEMTDSLRKYPRLFLAGAHLGGELGRQGYAWCLQQTLDAIEADTLKK